MTLIMPCMHGLNNIIQYHCYLNLATARMYESCIPSPCLWQVDTPSLPLLLAGFGIAAEGSLLVLRAVFVGGAKNVLIMVTI